MLRRVLHWALLLCWALPISASAAKKQLAEAKQAFIEAQAAFDSEQYAEALPLYEKGYELSGKSGFLFNIAQCHRFLKDYEQAIAYYERYLNEAPDGRVRGEAEQFLAESQAALDEERRREAAAAEAAAAEAAAAAAAASAKEASTPVESDGLSPVYFWSAVGLTTAAFTASLVTGLMTLSKHDDFENPALPEEERNDAKSSGETLQTVTNITLGIGGAMAVTSVVLFFFTDFSGSDGPIAFGSYGDGGLLTYRGTF